MAVRARQTVKHRKSRRVGRVGRVFGILISIVLPIIALQVTATMTSDPLIARFFGDFVIADLAVEVGIYFWKPRPFIAILEDLFVAGITGIGAWIAAKLSLSQGGAGVDPGLLALLTAYILWLWPYSRHRV